MSDAPLDGAPLGAQAQAILSELRAMPLEERRALLLTLFKAEVGTVLEIDPDFIDESASLPELGADSMRLIALVGRLRPLIGFTLMPNLLPVEAPISENVELIARVLDEPNPLEGLLRAQRVRLGRAIESDIYLLETPAPLQPPVSAAEARDPKHVLLTGASGFLGAYLVRTLFDTTRATIHCHVRAATAADGLARVRDNLTKFGLWSEEIASRLAIEVGDLGAERLGLSEERYTTLAALVDVIYHNGAEVHLTRSYSQLAAANVNGTRTILHLAMSHRWKPVAVISTVGLFDTPELEHIPAITEDMSPIDVTALPNGYTQTKWAGERLVERAAKAGLPAATIRVGHVIGEGVSTDLAARINLACLHSRAVPAITHPVDFIAPDYAAEAIVALPRNLSRFSEIYHLVNPRPLEPQDIPTLLPLSPVPLAVEPVAAWLQIVRDAALSDPTHPLFSAVDLLGDPERPAEQTLISSVFERPRIDCRRLTEALAGSSVRCPPAVDILADVISAMPEAQALVAQADTQPRTAART